MVSEIQASTKCVDLMEADVTREIIGAAIAVHQALGPGLVVDDRVVVELKSVERFSAIHESQLLTYLRLSKIRVGLLINFNVPVLRRGIVRRVL
jgi:hypothetical protein